ncbi:MAG: caspase family protein [Alphaproteobacteria bacterium]|nr:caspase family protein [Alphaproteobacteria bacterium]
MIPSVRHLALSLALVGLPSLGWADTRRFALIAGANDGGADRITLRYAVSDATAFGAVLEDLGGVPRSNQTLLIEPDRAVLQDAIHNLAETVKVAEERGMRTEVVFYYSGHSNEDGLLLGDTQYDYPALKEDLESIGADVRIAVLDSCASGALVRTKGGVARPAFLEDRSNDVEGTAYLMSSSADEAAQESDAVGASFFTHYLVSGLRGGADLSQDGRVTLDEAYRYATAETLKRTERTSLGAQHATYSYKLGGHGDFVFTDLSATTSSLVLDEGTRGRFFVRDDEGNLIAEVEKNDGRSVELALRPGTYTVVLDRESKQFDGVFDIGEAEHLMIGDIEFLEFQGEVATARGGQAVAAAPPDAPVAGEDSEAIAPLAPVSPGAMDPVDTGVRMSLGVARAASTGFELGVVGAIATDVAGTQIGTAFNKADSVEGMQVSLAYNQAAVLHGMQIAMGVNVVSGVSTGWQSAMFLNVASGELTGFQSAFVNVGERVRGIQTGFVNQAREAHGIQIGLVNAGGDGSGVQFGLVNVAGDYKGAAFGLVTVHKKGYNHVFVNSGTIDPFLVSASWGSQYVYTNVQLGMQFKSGGNPSLAVGIGGHLPIRKFYVDGDIGGGYRFGGSAEGPVVRFRVQPGFAFGQHFAIQTGIIVEAQSALGLLGPDPTPEVVTIDEVGRTVGWTVGLRF